VQWHTFQEEAVMYLSHHFHKDEPSLLLDVMQRLDYWQAP
jgi:hypothetical protein